MTLDGLILLDRQGLRQQWQHVFNSSPPRHAQTTLLRSALAWHLQIGDLSKSQPVNVHQTIKKLRRSLASSTPKRPLTPGTRLVREWHGSAHHVTVLASGFEYEAKRYSSLTAIARIITGTPWSGTLFFGLRS